MYIKTIDLNNIRTLSQFKMTFPKPAGWHVLIGDNGAGKSTIVRAIALGLLGVENARALSIFEDFSNWLPPHSKSGSISLAILRHNRYDMPVEAEKKEVTSQLVIRRMNGNGQVSIEGKVVPKNALWGEASGNGWYLSAYGPFRRLRGGNEAFAHIINSRPRLGACLSAFRDDVALTRLTAWLKDLALDVNKPGEKAKLKGIIRFINSAKLLPSDTILLEDIDSDGLKLKDANGVDVSLFEMSDGYRSVLGMTLDMIRVLLEIYGVKKVFPTATTQTRINLPGVVIIDEVDAHLHPTWQTQIGAWFTNYFPNIQFIVTTHSPLVCRACHNGSIWQLATPGSGSVSTEITGINKNRLIYGNVLDAYGTEVFGEQTSQSEAAEELIKELAALNVKSFKGTITATEKKRWHELKAILPTQP